MVAFASIVHLFGMLSTITLFIDIRENTPRPDHSDSPQSKGPVEHTKAWG